MYFQTAVKLMLACVLKFVDPTGFLLFEFPIDHLFKLNVKESSGSKRLETWWAMDLGHVYPHCSLFYLCVWVLPSYVVHVVRLFHSQAVCSWNAVASRTQLGFYFSARPVCGVLAWRKLGTGLWWEVGQSWSVVALEQPDRVLWQSQYSSRSFYKRVHGCSLFFFNFSSGTAEDFLSGFDFIVRDGGWWWGRGCQWKNSGKRWG